jgi:hypothetical protein
MTGSAAALVSFVESSDLLRELAGVEVSARQERAAECVPGTSRSSPAGRTPRPGANAGQLCANGTATNAAPGLVFSSLRVNLSLREKRGKAPQIA